MRRATVILKSGDEPSTVGTCSGGYLGASALCQRCGKPDLSWVPDSLYGGGWDACGTCGHRVRVPLRRTPPVEPVLVPGSLADMQGDASRDATAEAAKKASLNRALPFLPQIPTEWAPQHTVRRALGMSDTKWNSTVTALQRNKLVERRMEEVPDRRGRPRELVVVRRVA
ncbi:MAG: hypothetical protein ACK53T_04680 [Planctomycetota bacterium]